jgi:hypothetical protein
VFSIFTISRVWRCDVDEKAATISMKNRVAESDDFRGAPALIVAQRQSGWFLIIAVDGPPYRGRVCVRGGPAAIALDIHLEDRGVVHGAVDDRDSHRRVRGRLCPIRRTAGSGYQQRTPLVTGADQLEQHAGLVLTLVA